MSMQEFMREVGAEAMRLKALSRSVAEPNSMEAPALDCLAQKLRRFADAGGAVHAAAEALRAKISPEIIEVIVRKANGFSMVLYLIPDLAPDLVPDLAPDIVPASEQQEGQSNEPPADAVPGESEGESNEPPADTLAGKSEEERQSLLDQARAADEAATAGENAGQE